MKRAACLALLVAACSHQQPKPVQRGERTSRFEEVMERGARLAAYDKAVTLATAAVHPEDPLRAVAVETKEGWAVYFGNLDERQENFLVSFDALPEKTGYRAVAVDPPRVESGPIAAAARALRFLKWRPHTSYAVFPDDASDDLLIYAYPTTAEGTEAYIGKDLCLQISPDGRYPGPARHMHFDETRVKMEEGGKKVRSFTHRHETEDLYDTDVAFSIEHGIADVIVLPSKGAIMVNEFGVPHQFTEAEMRDLLNRKQ